MSELGRTAGPWIQVAVGLKNPSMRQLLGTVLAGSGLPEPLSKTQRKDAERWRQIGLLCQGPEGWQLNEQLLERTLASAAEAKADRSGILRYFDGPRLHTLPAKPADRFEVLRYVRDTVIDAQEQLGEAQLNERLRVLHPDVALLRRYLVDHGLVLRSADGSAYRLPAGN